MKAYMKSDMPYLGVQSTPLRRAIKPLFAAHRLELFEEWRDTVLTLWRGARHREERYAAIELAGFSEYRSFQTLDTLPLYEEMIVSGAWWDFVDTIAGHQIGGLLRRYPAEMASVLRAWAEDDDIWKRRTAILAQLGFKRETDLKLHGLHRRGSTSHLYDLLNERHHPRHEHHRAIAGITTRWCADSTWVQCLHRGIDHPHCEERGNLCLYVRGCPGRKLT